MSRSAYLLLPLFLLACNKDELPDSKQAAVNLQVSFNFKAGCIVVTAEDTENPQNTATEERVVFTRGAEERTLNVAIFRKEDWGRTLKLTASAKEEACDGAVVATKEAEVTLDEPGRQEVRLLLEGVDEDGDGYVPGPTGTDCDDRNAAIRRRSYYQDGDGDGVGTGGAVQGCTPPSARHVEQAGDCDDADGMRRPGLAEVCDDKDNDCNGQLDDGLAVTTYYRDADNDSYGTQTDSRQSCRVVTGYVTRNGDCDDGNQAFRPGVAEVCDDLDNDCDGLADDGLTQTTYYRDADGDTYGDPSDLRQSCRAVNGYVTRASDCDDSASAVRPGATEVCNDIDDNCAGGVDEGHNKEWYRDADGDTYGVQSDRMTGCTRPTGYVAPQSAFDCNDTTNTVRPGLAELCNDIDDNCTGGVDEGFTSGMTAKGTACSNPCPGGQYVCRPDGQATTCNAPAQIDYYADQDGDGAGDENATVQRACSATPPSGAAANRDDCDDRDRHNRRMGTEVCDDRDNNCVNGKDEGNVCNGASWAELTDTVVTGRDWNTVAVNQGSTDGYPVWIAGAGGALARRTSVGGFTSFDRQCDGTTTWNAAWVRPSDGSVYLAGSGGRVAQYNGTNCTAYTLAGSSNATGLVGFETGVPPVMNLVLYVVDESGRLHSWTPLAAGPNNAPREVDNNASIYRDIHGFDASKLFLTGQEDASNESAILERYTGGTDTSRDTIDNFGNRLNIRAVWMGARDFVYAVGDASIVLRGDGNSWAPVTPPAANIPFTSVCAPDLSSGYTTDATGIIRRFTGVGSTWVTHHTVGGALRDIALVSPTSVWAVGPGGRVVHFPGP